MSVAHEYERLLDEDGPTLVLEAANTYGTKVNAGGRTISAEALEGVGSSMLAWVASRLQRRLAAGRKASHVKVTVTVEFVE